MNLTKQPQNSKSLALRTQKFTKIVAIIAMLVFVVATFALPAFAEGVTINTGMTTEGLVGGIIDFVCTAAMYIGFVIAAAGIFMFIMAYKDDNAESQSRGARMAVVGALLIGLKPLLKLTGLIK